MMDLGREHPPWFTWRPQRSAVWPFVVLIVSLLGIVALLQLAQPLEPNLLLWAVVTCYLVLTTYYFLRVRRQSLDTLGAGENNWPQAMGMGAALGLLLGATVLFRSLLAGGKLVIPHLGLGLLAFVIPLALVVAGEELFFRGWFQASLTPMVGLAPAIVLASLVYALWPLAFLLSSPGARVIQTPIGLCSAAAGDLLLLFGVSLFLNGAYRMTGSLWASGLANFLSRFALVFVIPPQDFRAGASALALAVSLTLWAVVILSARQWQRFLPAEGAARRPQS